MKECGVTVEKEALTAFFAQIEGKSIPELVRAGEKKVATMPAVGAGGASASSSAAPAGAKAAEAPKEEKKEEVEDVDMGGLFGGDDEY